jgi:glycosyltransferase involved in cell wall biosynthesis
MNTVTKTIESAPAISACLIVRNEEKLLAKCLNSIRDYVDEIIVVDTGSSDRTVEIAESFGARIYHHPWEDHFSKHRNQSFSYAKNEWIFYIDADEEIMPGSGEILKKSITEAGEDIDAIAVTLECIFNEGRSISYNNAVRIFRNYRGFYYKGRVHNYIMGVKKVMCYPVHLFHHGYNLDKTGMSRKFERTTKLLKMDIADDPDDPRPHHFLSASYLSEFMSEEALKEANESIILCEKRQTFSHNYFWSLYIAAAACLNLGKTEEARVFAEKGIRRFPDHLDSHYILSYVAYESQDKKLFDNHFTKYLNIKATFQKNPEKFGEIVNNTIGSEWLLHLFRAFMLMDKGADTEAIKEVEAAKCLCPDLYLLHIRLGNYYLSHNRPSESEVHFCKAGEARPDDSWPEKLLASAYEKMNKFPEQAESLEKALKINNSDSSSLMALGLCRMKMGQFAAAETAFSKVINLNADNIYAVVNKGICLNELERYQEVRPILMGLKGEDDSLKAVILSNLAFSLHAGGNKIEAAEIFHELEKLDPTDLYPPIFLSSISLSQNDLEACVDQCDKLITLLEISKDKTLNSIEDLAYYYITAAKTLLKRPESRRLIKECLGISLNLCNNNPSLLADIGSLFLDIWQIRTGSEILKSALLLSADDDKLRQKISEIINSRSSVIAPASSALPSSM